MPGIAPKLPLQLDKTDGYRLTKTIKETVQQNLKMIVLTSPGERVMDPAFGVGLRNYLFRNIDEGLYGDISARIRTQVKKYLSFIRIEQIMFEGPDGTFRTDDSFLGIHVTYTILPTDDVNTLAINLTETIY